MDTLCRSEIKLLQERKRKVTQCDFICNKSHHRSPCSERKYFTSTHLPVVFWFITSYLILSLSSALPFTWLLARKQAIRGTFHTSLAVNVSPAADKGPRWRVTQSVCEGMQTQGCSVINGIQTDRKLRSSERNSRLIYVECGLCFYPHTERLQLQTTSWQDLFLSLPQTKQSGCVVPRRGRAAGKLHYLSSPVTYSLRTNKITQPQKQLPGKAHSSLSGDRKGIKLQRNVFKYACLTDQEVEMSSEGSHNNGIIQRRTQTYLQQFYILY